MENQKGVSLIITFFIMTIILAIVLSVSAILFNELKTINGIGDSVNSFYAADAGMEKTLYFDRKQIPFGATRGFCNICNSCNVNDCTGCVATDLVPGGCNVNSCTNCEITYSSVFGGQRYMIDAKVLPDATNPGLFDTTITSKGLFNNVMSQIQSSYIGAP